MVWATPSYVLFVDLAWATVFVIFVDFMVWATPLMHFCWFYGVGYPFLCTVCWFGLGYRFCNFCWFYGVGYPTFAFLLILWRELPPPYAFLLIMSYVQVSICYIKRPKTCYTLTLYKSGSPRLGTTSVGRTVGTFFPARISALASKMGQIKKN